MSGWTTKLRRPSAPGTVSDSRRATGVSPGGRTSGSTPDPSSDPGATVGPVTTPATDTSTPASSAAHAHPEVKGETSRPTPSVFKVSGYRPFVCLPRVLRVVGVFRPPNVVEGDFKVLVVTRKSLPRPETSDSDTLTPR